MSYTVNGNAIYLTRGDSFSAEIKLYQGDEEYTPEEGDVIRFAAKHPGMTAGNGDYLDAQPVLLKEIDHETMTLEIAPEDTKSLSFGEYVYDLEITFADGTVDTFITASPFIITAEVH